MSVAGISSTGLSGASSLQELQQGFQQLGRDLKSGNASAAQTLTRMALSGLSVSA